MLLGTVGVSIKLGQLEHDQCALELHRGLFLEARGQPVVNLAHREQCASGTFTITIDEKIEIAQDAQCSGLAMLVRRFVRMVACQLFVDESGALERGRCL